MNIPPDRSITPQDHADTTPVSVLFLRISLIVTGHFANNVTGFSTRLRGV
ncbi:hypothetical protein ACXM5X_32575 [Pseudomonas saponiphila]